MDVQAAFDGVNFEALQKKFKGQEVTPQKWYVDGEKVLRGYLKNVGVTNSLAQNKQHFNLYLGIPGNSPNFTIHQKGYFGVTGKSVLCRGQSRNNNQWSKEEESEFRDAAIEAKGVTYKYVEFHIPLEPGQKVDKSIKFVVERCLLQFVNSVGLSEHLFNENTAARDHLSKLSEYIPDASDRLKLGAFLFAHLLSGNVRYTEGSTHNLN